jgi:hypothetical protein
MTTINKRYSYPRVATIQINVHPVGENPISTPSAFHARFAYSPGPYISRDPRRQPFASSHKDKTDSYTRGKSCNRRQADPIIVLSHLIPLSHDSLGVGERGSGQVVTQLHQLTGHITPVCERYVQYLLTGPTHRSLNDTGGGYNHEGARFPHTTPRPSQLTVLPFLPKGPARSQVIQSTITK